MSHIPFLIRIPDRWFTTESRDPHSDRRIEADILPAVNPASNIVATMIVRQSTDASSS